MIERGEAALGGGSFEEVYAALEAAVARLEEGQMTLADSVACYELGVRLAARCEHFLDAAELRVRRIERIAERIEADVEAGVVPDTMPF
jgi:exodeoxyribonuclease VII small subunit